MPGKQVSQETFDAIVREAINDFGLDPNDALAEAKEQLTRAGVTDFTNIITSVPSDDHDEHPIVQVLRRVDSAAQHVVEQGKNRTDEAFRELGEVLDALSKEASKSPEAKGVAGARGGLDHIANTFPIVPAPSARVVIALCEGSEVNRGRFHADGKAMGALTNCLLNTAELTKESVGSSSEASDRVVAPPDASAESLFRTLELLLKALHVVLAKSEDGKQALFQEGSLIEAMLQMLGAANVRFVAGCESVRAACMIFRDLLSADDASKELNDTFNRARVLCGSRAGVEAGLRQLPVGTTPLPESLAAVARVLATRIVSPTEDSLLTKSHAVSCTVDCLALARMCAVSDEICAQLVELGFISIAIDVLSGAAVSCSNPNDCASGEGCEKPRPKGDVLLARACVSLLRSIAARDEAKPRIVSHIEEVARAVHTHDSDAVLAERYCGLVAALCLRRPDIARTLADEQAAADTVIAAMKKHPPLVGLQRTGSLCLRNLVVRNETVKARLRDQGDAESVLRAAWKMHPAECGDVAYGALYDLGVLDDSEMRRDRRYTTPF